MKDFYRGYVKTKNKKCVEPYKNRTDLRSLGEVQDLPEYAGILAEDAILVDVDDADQAETLMKIVEELQLECQVRETSRGMHFLFKNSTLKQCKTHTKTAIGLTVDIKVGCKASYEVLKADGKEREVIFEKDDDADYQEIPKWLYPVRCNMDFLTMDAGDGRNQALFNYILTLTANDFTMDETRECIRLLNRFVLKEPLPDDELEVILRDEAFEKPVFFKDKAFMFEKFAIYMKNIHHVVKINGQLHIYDDGVYVPGYRVIEKSMVQHIPNLRKTQRREVLDYMELICDPVTPADANYIAFRNGVYSLRDKKLEPFSENLVITNRIPWNYNQNAYSELADKTLDRLACHDKEIRALLEECIGYCFYRRSEMSKAFILTGDRANGKSTFLDVIKAILGDDNIAALDLSELGDRFSTAMMFGKLANIGDDIGDDFLQGTQVATFKKIVSGNRIKAERKGQDPFDFNPYVKLLFSANDIPRMRDKTGAVLRRLVIIPFDAHFSPYLPDGSEDPEYNSGIKYDLTQEPAIEYFIRVGLAALKRVVDGDHFTESEKVKKQLRSYEEENNPIISFINEVGRNEIVNEPTNDVYKRYTVFCNENSMQAMGAQSFTKQVCKRLNLGITQKRVGNERFRIYVNVSNT